MDVEVFMEMLREVDVEIERLKKGFVNSYRQPDVYAQILELKRDKDEILNLFLTERDVRCPMCHAKAISINDEIGCVMCDAVLKTTSKGNIYWDSEFGQTCIQCDEIFKKNEGYSVGYCSETCFDEHNETSVLESEGDIEEDSDDNPFEFLGKTEEVVVPVVEIDEDKQFLGTVYPFGYDNYVELLFNEFGRRFNRIEAYERPEKIIKKINRDRYSKLGGINKTVTVVCEKCHHEFKYVYRGGRKRMPCPECSDWSKRFPNEDNQNYERL